MNVKNSKETNIQMPDTNDTIDADSSDGTILADKSKKVIGKANRNLLAEEVKEKKPRGQKKGQVGEKTQEALKAGREKLKEKWDEDRKRQEELTQKYAIKKANALIREKLELKKKLGCEHMDSEDEEPLVVVQPKKAKKKQTIILPVESDSEEEIVVKKASKKTTSKPEPEPQQKPQPEKIVQSFGPRLFFY